jgi:enoyl-CoA hydratase/carnithine racemase
MSVVLTDFADGVAVITLNRPEAKNAVNLDLAKALAAAIDEFEERSDLTIGILTGAGGTFCAGMDLKGFARGERPSLPGRGFAGLTESPPSKPLIAAVEGWALAGGCELALAADLIVASTDAKFGLPEVKRGLAAAAGGLLRLPKILPYQLAMEIAITGGSAQCHRGASSWLGQSARRTGTGVDRRTRACGPSSGKRSTGCARDQAGTGNVRQVHRSGRLCRATRIHRSGLHLT